MAQEVFLRLFRSLARIDASRPLEPWLVRLTLNAAKSHVTRNPVRHEDELPDDFGVEFNAGAGGYYRSQELSTYVLRQADRVVWFKVYSGTKDGSLLIAETDAAATP